eukprot:358392-Chlamydomonas_euryale.AAC.12
MTVWSEVAVTVSRNDTTGSDTLIDLQVQLASAGNNVLASLLDVALDHGVRARQALEALHQLGQVRRDLGLHRHTHDRRHRELHRLHRERVGLVVVGQRRRLGDELVQADQCAGVAARHVLDGVLLAAHAEHGALHSLDEQVLLLARDVVGAHDADLGAGGNAASEHAAERKKAPRVRRGNHLGDVHHEWAVRVAVADRRGVHVVERALVQRVHAVLLSLGRRRQVVHNHLQQCDRRGKPGLHNTLHQRLSHQLLVVGLELGQYAQLLEHWEQLVLVVIHGQVDHLLDGLVAELVEAPLA